MSRAIIFQDRSFLAPESGRSACRSCGFDVFGRDRPRERGDAALEAGSRNPGQNDDAVRMEEEFEPVAWPDLQALPNRLGDGDLALAAESGFHHGAPRFTF